MNTFAKIVTVIALAVSATACAPFTPAEQALADHYYPARKMKVVPDYCRNPGACIEVSRANTDISVPRPTLR